MSLDGLPPAHLRVLLDGLPVFERYGLLLAGGYAFRAHERTVRELMPVLSLCDQVDLWCYGRSAGLAVLG